MINNPNLLNELIKRLDEIPEYIIKNSIKEVIQEDECISDLKNLLIKSEEYKSELSYNKMKTDIFYFDILHISTSIQETEYQIQSEEAA